MRWVPLERVFSGADAESDLHMSLQQRSDRKLSDPYSLSPYGAATWDGNWNDVLLNRSAPRI